MSFIQYTFHQIFMIFNFVKNACKMWWASYNLDKSLKFVYQNTFGFVAQSFGALVILLVPLDISGTLTVPSQKVRMVTQGGSNMLSSEQGMKIILEK